MRCIALILCAAAVSMVCATRVFAGTPLDPGGDDTGFVAPGKDALRCERYMNKRATLATLCTLKCHVKNVDAIFKNLPFDDSVCEDTGAASCQAKYVKSLALLSPSLCPPCLDGAGQLALYPEYRDVAESLNGVIYCDDTSAVPFGDDDTGFASLRIDVKKCEDAFARNVDKLIKCINLRCHRAMSDDLFFGAPLFNETACEETDPTGSCKARFESANALLVGCPPCLDETHRAQVFNTIEQALDSRAGLVYCAQ